MILKLDILIIYGNFKKKRVKKTLIKIDKYNYYKYFIWNYVREFREGYQGILDRNPNDSCRTGDFCFICGILI